MIIKHLKLSLMRMATFNEKDLREVVEAGMMYLPDDDLRHTAVQHVFIVTGSVVQLIC